MFANHNRGIIKQTASQAAILMMPCIIVYSVSGGNIVQHMVVFFRSKRAKFLPNNC